MSDDLSPAVAVLIGVTILLGAFVQSAVGVGSGMVGTPVIALVEPDLVPSLLLLVTIQISLWVWVSVPSHVNWRTLAWAVPPRLPGTLLGAWLLTVLTPAALGVAIALTVLVAVAVVWRAIELEQTAARLVVAGLASGVTGTAAAIDGPPMVVLMAHRPRDEVRATMAVFFLVGSLLSLVALASQGEVPRESVTVAAWCLPLVIGGSALGGQAGRRLPRETFRHAVLGLCAASAVMLLVKSLA